MRKIAFECNYRGFQMRVFYRADEKDQNADVEITRGGEPFKTCEYPAYRIWNLQAHYHEMIEEFLENDPPCQ